MSKRVEITGKGVENDQGIIYLGNISDRFKSIEKDIKYVIWILFFMVVAMVIGLLTAIWQSTKPSSINVNLQGLYDSSSQQPK